MVLRPTFSRAVTWESGGSFHLLERSCCKVLRSSRELNHPLLSLGSSPFQFLFCFSIGARGVPLKQKGEAKDWPFICLSVIIPSCFEGVSGLNGSILTQCHSSFMSSLFDIFCTSICCLCGEGVGLFQEFGQGALGYDYTLSLLFLYLLTLIAVEGLPL